MDSTIVLSLWTSLNGSKNCYFFATTSNNIGSVISTSLFASQHYYYLCKVILGLFNLIPAVLCTSSLLSVCMVEFCVCAPLNLTNIPAADL